jgi:hypothetical protein
MLKALKRTHCNKKLKFKLVNISSRENYYFLRLLSKNSVISSIDYSIDKDVLYVHQVNTHKLYQGNGYATKLIKIAESDAKNNKIFMSKFHVHESKERESLCKKLGYDYSYDDKGNHIKWEINPNYIEMFKML